jgi:tRNA dimethylallyltransferase
VIGLQTEVSARRQRVADRLHARISEGLIAEVDQLMKSGLSSDTLKFYGLEYKLVTAHLLGEMGYDEMIERLTIAICQFAKRQATFFRKMEKDGVRIHWLSADENFDLLYSSALALIQHWIRSPA